MDVQRFGVVEFDPAQRRLTVKGRPVELDRSSAAILSILVGEAPGEVGKDRLLEAGWPGRLVHENSLAKAISRLRQALGADGEALETVHGYGYRLAANVETGAATTPQHAAHLRKPARSLTVLVLTAIIAVAAWGAIEFQGSRARHVVNGESAESVGRVLWVDDHPDNNLDERRYLEQHKIAFYRVANTEEALSLLQMYAYGAVISDMGRGDRPLAGIDLLKGMRARGDGRPFILYTVYPSDAQRKLLADYGGQGVAATPGELYAALLPLFGQAPVAD
uniref:winged helix-turn-helix domain-containing protein n=1 Tax=Altererythrobacter segetis TaxID=1104773 RepID=UPI0014080B08|nr:winged helix-turn-helix domain-containing protein [Altererythrobacter segetis]